MSSNILKRDDKQLLATPKEGPDCKHPLLLDTAGSREPILLQQAVELPLRHHLIVRLRVPWIVQRHLETAALFGRIPPSSAHHRPSATTAAAVAATTGTSTPSVIHQLATPRSHQLATMTIGTHELRFILESSI